MSEYLTKKMLSKLGHTFDSNDLECWQVEAYSIIAKTFQEEEEKELKRKKK